MADGGQDFLKICGIYLPANYDPDLDRGLTDEELERIEDEDERSTRKRSL